MRNLCCKCPHYYEQHGYECDDVDWGCTAFGREFENCMRIVGSEPPMLLEGK